MRAFLLLALAGCGLRSEPVEPPPVQVHLSIDDAPWHIGTMPPEERKPWNDRLLGELAAREVTASVFFVCERMSDGDGTVEAWAQAGHVVGNHTHTHARLAAMSTEDWLQDARTCHEQLTARLGAPPTWFRYPYLGHGDGAQAQKDAREGLAAMGYRNAPVTVATTEWMYAYAYRRAAGDEARRAEVVADWHRHMDEALEVARSLATSRQGREVPQVVLVHLNELVVEHVGDLLDRWRGQGVRFVDLPTAMADPLYAMHPRYTGPAGLSWLVRVGSPDQIAPYWFGEEERRVIERFGPPPVRGEE